MGLSPGNLSGATGWWRVLPSCWGNAEPALQEVGDVGPGMRSRAVLAGFLHKNNMSLLAQAPRVHGKPPGRERLFPDPRTCNPCFQGDWTPELTPPPCPHYGPQEGDCQLGLGNRPAQLELGFVTMSPRCWEMWGPTRTRKG